jgi:hypothetical protein
MGMLRRDYNVLDANESWQDSEDAKFSDCALPYISAIPLAISILVALLGLSGRLLGRWRPEWTRAFIIEYPEDDHETAKTGHWSLLRWVVILITFTILGLAASIVQLVFDPRDLSTIFLLVSWLLTALIISIARPRTSPGYLCVFYLTAFSVEFLNVLSAGIPSGGKDITHYIACTSAFASLVVILVMRLRDPALPAIGVSKVGDAPSSDERSPEDNLRLWQFLSISWMFPLIRVGKQRTLNEDDVWYLAYEFQHGRLFDKFSTLSGTVVRRLLKANGLDVCILTLSASVETTCSMFISGVIVPG